MSERNIWKKTRYTWFYRYGAALWAVIFAFLHFVWAAGCYIGLNAAHAQKAFQQKWFLIYDIIAGVLCLFGGMIALLMTVYRKQSALQKIIRLAAWFGVGVLILRGGAGIIKIIYLLIMQMSFDSAIFWDVWFCLGAMLFTLTVVKQDSNA